MQSRWEPWVSDRPSSMGGAHSRPGGLQLRRQWLPLGTNIYIRQVHTLQKQAKCVPSFEAETTERETTFGMEVQVKRPTDPRRLIVVRPFFLRAAAASACGPVFHTTRRPMAERDLGSRLRRAVKGSRDYYMSHNFMSHTCWLSYR
jgi:hypothetical protein